MIHVNFKAEFISYVHIYNMIIVQVIMIISQFFAVGSEQFSIYGTGSGGPKTADPQHRFLP